MKVSVLIPARNAEATLGETLRSALGGTYENIELLVVDNGSEDATAEVADAFARSDSRVRLHRKSGGGVSAAFNAALHLAEGDFIARLDADDIWHPTKLQKQVALALDAPETPFIYSFVRYIDDEARVVRDVAPQRFPPRALCRGIYESLVGGNSSALIRRSAVEQAGGYDQGLSSWEDLLLQLRISAHHQIAFVPEYLVGYRIRPKSLSADPANMLASWLAVRRRIEALFPEVPAFVRRWAHGKRCADLAEAFAWKSKYPTSAKLLLEAMRTDPVRTSLWLTYRSARHLGNRLSNPPAAGAMPHFLDCRPDQQVRLDRYDDGLEGGRLRRLEERRAAKLGDLDQALALRPGGAA
jgi:glycosyltransferase involved in cell wall biosynthesis